MMTRANEQASGLNMQRDRCGGRTPGQSLQQTRRTPENRDGTRRADAVLSFAGQRPGSGAQHGLRAACVPRYLDAKGEGPNSRRRAMLPGRLALPLRCSLASMRCCTKTSTSVYDRVG
jgi:hypothetical protein